jgi:hypothetical protein
VSQWGHYFLFLHAAIAFDVLGTDNAGELDTYHVVSNILFCQYPFSILWPEFLVVSDTALLCYMLEKVVSIKIDRPFSPV